ncbi:MAG TPA: UDP-glucose 4-epimerase GalE [Chloroflexota bacterium]|nr:UDP-glucose 4-epimerase GalE [Chloroflexota bacterium]
MRVLVTGGAGYVGSHTVRLLLEAGHEVTVYDNLVYGHRAAVPCPLVVGDLADRARLDQVFAAGRFDAVLHFAAYAYVGESVADPAKYFRNNLGGGLALLDAMLAHGVERLVFSSTCATYGEPTRLPITEEEPQRPTSPYGETKLAFERALYWYAQAYGLRSVSLRYFNAAGAALDGTLGEDHEPETHLIPRVLRVALGQEPYVEVYGTDYPTPDGTCLRDYVHVLDLAAAHLLALERLDRPGLCLAYNLGAGRGYSVQEVIATCRRVTGRPIPTVAAPRRPGDPPALYADNTRARRELGWTPAYSELETIVATAWAWHRAHPHGFREQEAPQVRSGEAQPGEETAWEPTGPTPT